MYCTLTESDIDGGWHNFKLVTLGTWIRSHQDHIKGHVPPLQESIHGDSMEGVQMWTLELITWDNWYVGHGEETGRLRNVTEMRFLEQVHFICTVNSNVSHNHIQTLLQMYEYVLHYLIIVPFRYLSSGRSAVVTLGSSVHSLAAVSRFPGRWSRYLWDCAACMSRRTGKVK